MKVLITGGIGFIGSHLVERLSNEHDITIIDNVKNGNISFLDKVDHIRLLEHDIGEPFKLQENYDYIFHLAANADVRNGVKNPEKDIYSNILGTYHLLEAIKNKNPKKLIFTSSATIYGENYNYITEDNADFKPISIYGASKLSAEKLILAYANNFNLDFTIFRLSNIVGERNTHGIIRDFVSKLKKDPSKLEILGKGDQTKQYLYISDCIDGLVDIGLKNTKEHIFNLACDKEFEVKEIADIVISEMGLKNVNKIFTNTERGWIGDVPFTLLDTSRIRSEGWLPKIDSEEGVRRTVRYLQDNL